jgi:PAS domain S-box-containing protein
MCGGAADAGDPLRPLFGLKGETGTGREVGPVFDDVKEPMATIELDGHFRELNQAFTDLVGYSEEDFKSASWPPVMDRANLPKHREQMKLLLAGEIDSAEVNTGYVHAQGLLVPVIGTISLVRSEEGEPDHFLLSAKS